MASLRAALLVLSLATCSRAGEQRPKASTPHDASLLGAIGAAEAPPRAIELALGHDHSCVLLDDGRIRCWGLGAEGRLGTRSVSTIGDNEPSATAATIDLGGRAIHVTAGEAHTCALLASKRVRCWGRGTQGQLGYGSAANIGDDETPASVGDVPLSEEVAAVSAGGNRTCALLASGAIRCWGDNFEGGLGYPGRRRPGNLGDDESVESLPAIQFDRRVAQLTCDAASTCVRFEDGGVRCWGGVLGSSDSEAAAATRSDIEVGAPVARLASATVTCAITTRARARCWGMSNALPNNVGVDRNSGLGFAAVADVGDLPLDGAVQSIALSRDHGCALVDGGQVKCWGAGRLGILGVPDGTTARMSISEAVVVDLGEPAFAVAVGAFHSCAITSRGGVRCWGMAQDGRLGYGTMENVGESRPPSVVGDVPLFP